MEGDDLVGILEVERAGDREVRLNSVFVLEPFRLRGIGRAMVEAVIAGAPVERFVADSDENAVGFFEKCGFAVSRADDLERFHCIRFVRVGPASPAAVTAFTLNELEAAIRASWGSDTSGDPDEWTTDNPARGQCDATAVLVRSYLGGDILIADILRNGRRVERHAWNRLLSGLMIDLTRDQFRNGELLSEPVAEEPLLLGDALQRHRLLAQRVDEFLRGSEATPLP